MAIFSGDIFAENYTVSSSVTNVQISSVVSPNAVEPDTEPIVTFVTEDDITYCSANMSPLKIAI